MKVKTLKQFQEVIEYYTKYFQRDHNMIGLEKHTLDKDIFSSDSKILASIEKEIANNNNFLICKTSVFLSLLKNSMEEDREFNIDPFLSDDTNFPRVRYIVIRNYLFRDVSIFDNLTKDSYDQIRKLSVSSCSLEKLEAFLKDKNKTIRLMAYSRLGPIGYNKKALKDRIKTIRGWGIENTPYFDRSLGKLSNERSTTNYLAIIEKVSKEDLPFFLSPSFLNNKNIGNYIKQRIKNEIKKRLS
jgi:hypothetical protein